MKSTKPLDFSELKSLSAPNSNKTGGTQYIICNEQDQEKSLKFIANQLETKSHQDDHPHVHIGFSIWFNLDLLATTYSEYALIFDIDEQVFPVYETIKSVFNKSDTPEKFVNNLLKELHEKDLSYFPIDYLTIELTNHLTKGFGFLSSQDKFLRVKKLCDDGKIFFGKADLTSEDNMKTIASWCKKNNVTVDSLYLSNIPEWIYDNASKEALSKLLENIKPLINKNTLVIDAFYPTSQKKLSGPPQRVFRGHQPEFKKETLHGKHKKHHTFSYRQHEEEVDDLQHDMILGKSKKRS